MLRYSMLLCITMLLPMPVAAQSAPEKRTTYALIRCESPDFRRSFCPADTRMGVRLTRQLSAAPCVRGRTWWRDARGIVVTEGCGAEFEIGYRDEPYAWDPSHGSGGLVQPERLFCASQDYRRRYCPADIDWGVAVLVRQTSSAPCQEGRSFGYDRRGVWVDRGCAGEFEIGYADNAWRPGSDARWLRCESRDYQQSVCPARNNRGVTMVRQVSRAACVQGRSWDFDRNRIWVSSGCAADFEVR